MINLPENQHVNPSLKEEKIDLKKTKCPFLKMMNKLGKVPKNLKNPHKTGEIPLDNVAKKEYNTKEEHMHPHMKKYLEMQKVNEKNKADNFAEILASLSEDEKNLMIGIKTEDPLHKAFPKKRVVHPGATGMMIPTVAREAAFNHYMEMTTLENTKRACYIHIPFCAQKCLYCGFFQNYTNEEMENYYVDRLVKQLNMAKKYNYISTGEISAVFFGGGTPSALSPKNITRVLKGVHENLPLSDDCEITMESTVHDLVDDKLQAWFAGGVNRISIGVQSFDTEIRQIMGRKNSKEVVIEKMKNVASYNKAVIVVDLIYGLPNQSVLDFKKDLEEVLNLPIDGMDLYQLNIFENSPLKAAIDNCKIAPAATTVMQADFLNMAIEFLAEKKLKRLSVCHWAKNDKERSRYNLLAKSNAEVIPFGSGAGGYVKDISMFLERDLKKYCEMVDEGKWPFMVMVQEAQNKPLYKEIQSQMESLTLDLNNISAVYGKRVKKIIPLLDIWVDNNLLDYKDGKYTLTNAGQFWQNNLTQTIIEVLERLLVGNDKMTNQPIAAQG